MNNAILLDSDVILKLCIYVLLVWEENGYLCNATLATLAASRFILPRRLQKKRNIKNPKAALEALQSLMLKLQFIEPTPAEIEWAAEIELMAQRAGAAFDLGESQLLAILIHRHAALLITGDKRAIAALPVLGISKPEVKVASGRIACLEQLFLRLLNVLGGEALQLQICREPEGDKTLANCFCCASGAQDEAQFEAGLMSYISHVRSQAGEILCLNDFTLPAAS